MQGTLDFNLVNGLPDDRQAAMLERVCTRSSMAAFIYLGGGNHPLESVRKETLSSVPCFVCE